MKRNFIMHFPNGRAKALTFSYDDNVRDNARLVEILNRHGMKGTFNLNSGLYNEIPRYMSAEETTALFADSPHEIALHSATHPFLNQLPTGLAAYEILHDRECLEKQFNRFVRGMAYPNNSYNDAIVDMLKSVGVVYARTTDSTGRFDIPTDWLRMPATCHHNDPRLMELASGQTSLSVTYIFLPAQARLPLRFRVRILPLTLTISTFTLAQATSTRL